VEATAEKKPKLQKKWQEFYRQSIMEEPVKDNTYIGTLKKNQY